MMNVGKHARVAVAALAIGGAVLSLGTGHAEAAKIKHPPDNGVRCWRMENGHWEAYLPGDIVTGTDGKEQWQCQSDGSWRMVRTDGSGGGTNNGAGHQGAYGAP